MKDTQKSSPNATEKVAVQVVVVNWNSGAWLKACLDSISQFSRGSIDKVVVVDNGSIDGSANIECSEVDLTIIRVGENLGFAKACNLGAREATASYLLFLNPDAALLEGSLPKALAFMESTAAGEVAVCGIQLIDETGAVQHHTTTVPKPQNIFTLTMLQNRFDHLHSRPVDHVIGAFYLVRREVFEAVGGFDERFFVYLEDVDLSVRIQQAGWKVHYLAEAVAFHKGGGTSEQVKAHRLFYSLQSRLLYAFKHFSTYAAWWVFWVTISVELFARLLRGSARGSLDEVANTIKGYQMLLGAIPRIVGTPRRSAPSP